MGLTECGYTESGLSDSGSKDAAKGNAAYRNASKRNGIVISCYLMLGKTPYTNSSTLYIGLLVIEDKDYKQILIYGSSYLFCGEGDCYVSPYIFADYWSCHFTNALGFFNRKYSVLR